MAEKRFESKGKASGGYTSEFSEVDEDERKRYWKDDKLSGIQTRSNNTSGLPTKRTVVDEFDKEEARTHRFHILSLDAYSRHKLYINNYLKYYGGKFEDFKRDCSKDKTDFDILKEEHSFVWSEDDDIDTSWEKRLAKKYYDKLFKEYCITDLTYYKQHKIALRWRIEKEVLNGKGQFICGNKKCDVTAELQSWEVNFAYVEHGEKKNALVKLRLCMDCSYKLNYHHKHRKMGKRKSKKRKSKKRQKLDGESNSDDSSSEKESDTAVKGSEEQHETAEEIWKKPAKIVVEKTREQEFDDYFNDMFL